MEETCRAWTALMHEDAETNLKASELVRQFREARLTHTFRNPPDALRPNVPEKQLVVV